MYQARILDRSMVSILDIGQCDSYQTRNLGRLATFSADSSFRAAPPLGVGADPFVFSSGSGCPVAARSHTTGLAGESLLVSSPQMRCERGDAISFSSSERYRKKWSKSIQEMRPSALQWCADNLHETIRSIQVLREEERRKCAYVNVHEDRLSPKLGATCSS